MARTKAQLKKLHRELWQWLADNPGAEKWDWPRFDEMKAVPVFECFACEAAGRFYGRPDPDFSCGKCPCEWGVPHKPEREATCTSSAKSIYVRWRNTHNGKLRTKYALQVRDAWK